MATRKKIKPLSIEKRPASEPLMQQDEGVLDINEAAEVIPFNYAITAYGADYPVDSLVPRLRSGDVFVPLFSRAGEGGDRGVRFQREFVWTKLQSDRFVESLLLGLPVPGIFLVKEANGRLLVLDGHQRLRTLQGFYDNCWEEGEYRLEYVQERFQGCGYSDLETEDRRRIDDAIIHATIVRQDEPSNDQSSIYLIFERLNSGGTSLQPQEIRVALYHGPLVSVLSALNDNTKWRILYGKKSKRLKDIELILRFFALFFCGDQYRRPMKGFLNAYMASNRRLERQSAEELETIFERTVSILSEAIGPRVFRPQRSLNAAVFDAIMVGVARRLSGRDTITSTRSLETAYRKLLEKGDFQAASQRATADEESVRLRLELATKAFAKVP